MNRLHRASSETKLLLLVVHTVIAISTITGTIYADPKSKSIDFQSSLEEIHRGEDDDNAVIVDGKWTNLVQFVVQFVNKSNKMKLKGNWEF